MNRVAWLVLVAAAGCSRPASEATDTAPTAAVAAPKAKVAQVAAPVDPAVDKAGNLLPSGRKLAWLELPKGLEEKPLKTARQHVFTTRATTFEHVQAYFVERVAPTRIEPLAGGSVILWNCLQPSTPGAKQTRLTLTLTKGGEDGETKVFIEETPYIPPDPSFGDREARALLKQQLKRAE